MSSAYSPAPKTAVITGTTHGIGAALEKQLMRAGWRLITVNRSAAPPQEGIHRVTADLADPASARDAVAAILAHGEPIDLLINNAGVLLPEYRYTATGLEHHYTTNVLAPYLLSTGLRNRLRAGATIITVSSFALFRAAPLDVDALRWPTGSMRKLFGVYAQSKLATSMVTAALSADFDADGIALRSVDPGPTRSNMTAGDGLPIYLRPWRPFFSSAEKAAAGIVRIHQRKPGGVTDTYLTSKLTPKTLPDHALDPRRQGKLLERLDHDSRIVSPRTNQL
jgi:NAD(P)-dependent dehydrogenase (short-subunit alcohol dehydrogenase family)